MRVYSRWTVLLLLLAVRVTAEDTKPRTDAATAQVMPAGAHALQASKTVSFSDGQWMAWKNPITCGSDGSVYLILVPKADPRDVKALKAKRGVAKYTKKPSSILRVRPDGKRVVINPSTATPLADADDISTSALAFDSGGTLHALVWAQRDDGEHEYVMSFDDTGSYKAHFELAQDEIVANRIEFFGSGSALLQGGRPHIGPRVVVVGPGGNSFLDVTERPTNDQANAPSPPTPPRVSDRMARAGNGSIYYVPPSGDAVHLIEESGQAEKVFDLLPMPRSYRLVDLKGDRSRLYLTYYQEMPEQKARFWIATYDLTLGERVAVYGPAAGVPVCYRRTDQGDEFTLLKDAQFLVTVSPQ